MTPHDPQHYDGEVRLCLSCKIYRPDVLTNMTNDEGMKDTKRKQVSRQYSNDLFMIYL